MKYEKDPDQVLINASGDRKKRPRKISTIIKRCARIYITRRKSKNRSTRNIFLNNRGCN